MGINQKEFYKTLMKNWLTRFPLLKPATLPTQPKHPKGSAFVCDNYFGDRKRVYVFYVEFSRVRSAEFTLNVIISDSPERTILPRLGKWELESQEIGLYRIAAFMGRQDYLWALRDMEADVDTFFNSLGVPGSNLAEGKKPNAWKPTSYDLPASEITAQALEDLNSKIENVVCPRLGIKLTPH